MKRLAIIIMILFCSTVYASADMDALINQASFIPGEEAYVHIAGGFFSVFESRVGRTYATDQCIGSICMKLNKLKYSSQFVYHPEGKIVLKTGVQDKVSFDMSKLDYIQYGIDNSLCYRLACKDAVLICAATGKHSPILEGQLFLISDNTIKESCTIRIAGRGENEADNHLHKVIARISEF